MFVRPKRILKSKIIIDKQDKQAGNPFTVSVKSPFCDLQNLLHKHDKKVDKTFKSPFIDSKSHGPPLSSKPKVYFGDVMKDLDGSNVDLKNVMDSIFSGSGKKKESIDEVMVESKIETFKPSSEREIDVLKNEINTIEDLIKVGDLFEKEDFFEKNYSVNIEGIHKMSGALKELQNMIGLLDIKRKIVKQILYFSQSLHNGESDMMHTVIQGPPGVGKTQLGEILSKIYLALGLSKNSKFIKVKRADLIGKYLGHTAIKTQTMIDKANGGVLFIDEAYSLGSIKNSDSYSKECLDTLNQNLSENKSNFICIIAGYEESLDTCFFSCNPGLRRRFNFEYTIEKYTSKDLINILKKKVIVNNWIISDDAMCELNETKIVETNMNDFIYFGGDVERWFTNIKIEHAHRVFGKEYDLQKKLTWSDIQNGFKRFKKTKKEAPIMNLSMYT